MVRFLSLFVAATLTLSSLASVAPAPRDYAWTDLAISSRPDGRYLHRTTSGEPFLWVADTNWEMFHRMNYTDVDLYLADRSAKGFNVIQAVLLSKYNVTTTPNFFGDLAIDNSDPKQPNEAYFSFVDWVVARAAEYNILVCLVPVWGRYVSAGWYGTIGPRLFDEENGYWLGKYLGKRYPGLPKMMGGDTNGFWANNVPQARQAWRDDPHGDPTKLLDPVEDTRGIWAAMMKGFKEEEAKAGYEAFVTFQPTSPWISNPPTPLPYGHNYINGTFGTLSMDAVQSGHESPDPNGVDANFTVLTPWDSNKNYENILEMREQFSGPVMDVENHYELAHDSFDPSKPLWNASHVRHGFYPAIMSGACGVTYGSLPVQQTYARLELVASPEHYWEPQLGLEANTSWQEGIHLPGAKQTGYVADLFNSLSNDEFDGLEPAREYLSSPVGAEQDIMQFEGTRYVAGMITMGYYWVYTGYGDPFQVDLDAVASRWQTPVAMYTAQWFDPRTGKPQHADLEKPQIAIGQRTFTPPSCGGIDHDWVLVIRTNQYCT